MRLFVAQKIEIVNGYFLSRSCSHWHTLAQLKNSVFSDWIKGNPLLELRFVWE